MGIKLLGVETVPFDQEILNPFRRPEAICNKWIVKNPITAGRHLGSRSIVRVFDGGADVAIDVTKSHASLFLEHRCCGFLKVAQDKSKISQADPLDIVAQLNHIDVGEPARAMSVHSAISSRHSAKGIKANDLNSGQEFLSQRGHENRGPPPYKSRTRR